MDLLEYLSQQVRATDDFIKKAQYRKDLLKALIVSYPPGTPISQGEVEALLDMKPDPVHKATRNFIYQLKSHGEIDSEPSGSRTRGRAYTVLKPGNTYDRERESINRVPYMKPGQVIPVGPDEPVIMAIEKPVKKYTFEELEQLAMKWYFYHPQGTIAEFLIYLKETYEN